MLGDNDNNDKQQVVYQVFYIGPSGNKVVAAQYDDEGEAKDHVQGLRKIYKSAIVAGYKPVPIRAAFKTAIYKCLKVLRERKNRNKV